MSIYHHIKIIFLVTCIAGFSWLYAQEPKHLFEIEKGVITYDIIGEAVLTEETNLSIKGKAKLRFREWGDIKIEEEDNVVLTKGAIKHRQEVKRFTKHTKDSIITVDYENEQLLERKKYADDVMSEQTRFLSQNGQEEVAGVMCDIWEGAGIKKCIYKGIVLKAVSQVLGVTYTKIATTVTFDVNASEESCATPDYPVHPFALIQDSTTTQNELKPQKFSIALKNIAYDINENNTSYGDNNISDEERMKFINHIGQDIYTRQKELLPALLIAMKETRECLQTSQDPIMANECMANFSRMKTHFGSQKESYILLWDDTIKNTLLDKIEDELIELEARMPCINRAKNITDLSACMK